MNTYQNITTTTTTTTTTTATTRITTTTTISTVTILTRSLQRKYRKGFFQLDRSPHRKCIISILSEADYNVSGMGVVVVIV